MHGEDEGIGTDRSIFVTLMRGDYDDDLQWPFEGDIALELLNWNNDNRHFRGNVSVTDPNGSCTSRVSQREYAPSGWGKNFISHLSLQYNPTEYLQDDCLRLRVVDVAVYSTPLLSKIPSWQDPHTADQSVCDFTLTEFTKRKQFNNVCYSPPFYEYEQGYKMLLHVFMNGQQSARATHISVYAHLMKGEYDDDLDWPFEGIITVELLNWREDKNHLSHTIVFDQHTDLKHSSRVAEENIAEYGWGDRHDFFSHSSLPYNPVTNTEYLQDDCLRFRVRVCSWHSLSS